MLKNFFTKRWFSTLGFQLETDALGWYRELSELGCSSLNGIRHQNEIISSVRKYFVVQIHFCSFLR